MALCLVLLLVCAVLAACLDEGSLIQYSIGSLATEAAEHDRSSPCTPSTIRLSSGTVFPACIVDDEPTSNPWFLFGDIDSQRDNFFETDVTSSPTSSGQHYGNSTQVGTFSAGSVGTPGFSFDVNQLADQVPGTFDLMIQFGNTSVKTVFINGFIKNNGIFINNDHVGEVGVTGEHGMWGTQTSQSGYYANYCALTGGCAANGRGTDYWTFSRNGVYPGQANQVVCGFFGFYTHWAACDAGDNIERMRYYIRGVPRSSFGHDLTVSSTKDPHCRNVRGEAFDIFTTGNLGMVHAPRDGATRGEDLTVTAQIQTLFGKGCGPTYITAVEITGLWLGMDSPPVRIIPAPRIVDGLPLAWQRLLQQGAAKAGNVHMVSRNVDVLTVRLVQHKLIVMIQQRRLPNGQRYLDLHINGLTNLGGEVGGLLGLDGHTLESQPSENCKQEKVTLQQTQLADDGTGVGISAKDGWRLLSDVQAE